MLRFELILGLLTADQGLAAQDDARESAVRGHNRNVDLLAESGALYRIYS